MKKYDDGYVDPEAFQEKADPISIRMLQEREAIESQRIYVLISLPIINHKIVFCDDYLPENNNNHDFEVHGDDDIGEYKDPVQEYWKEYYKRHGCPPEDIQPSAKAYKYLMNLMDRPITWNWTPEHKAVIWKYRYWLRQHENVTSI